MADDSDGEWFCVDPFGDDSDGGHSCDCTCSSDEDDEGEWLGGRPRDDDDSNGEEICEGPYVYDGDDDDDGESEESLYQDDDDGESEESLCVEELSDDDKGEGKGRELGDDPCDDEYEVESVYLSEDPSDHDEDGRPEALRGGGGGLSVSGFYLSESSYTCDSVEDYSASEVEEAAGFNLGGSWLMLRGFDQTPSPGAFRMVVRAEDINSTDSDFDIDDSDYEDDYEFHMRPASREAVEGLPEAVLSEEAAMCGCAVCKDVFEPGQRVVFLPCKHYFHGDCIRPWLAIRSTCPVCRYQLPTDDTQSGQRQAHQLRVLVPVARQIASQQV